MKHSDVAVATITWARTSNQESELLASLNALARVGLPVAVANRGDSDGFEDRLRELPGFQVCQPSSPGLVAQVQASVAAAARFDRRFILYVEPDKTFFFERRMRPFLDAVPDRDTLGVAIASRTATSFATFPPMQRFAERVINRLCADLIGVAGDYSYGPFLLHRALLPIVAAMPPSLGWGWRHAAFLAAQRERLEVLHVTGSYPCPPDQRQEDAAERAHRMRQLSENILGLVS